LGSNTLVLIHNDRLGSIEKDADEFVRSLVSVCGGGRAVGPFPTDFHLPSGAQVVQTWHADGTVTVLAGGNSATVVGTRFGSGHHKARNQVDYLEGCLRKLGFAIRRQVPRELTQTIENARRDLARVRRCEPPKGHRVPLDEYRRWERECEFYEDRLLFLEGLQAAAGTKEKKEN
jgi:hypothetical protein